MKDYRPKALEITEFLTARSVAYRLNPRSDDAAELADTLFRQLLAFVRDPNSVAKGYQDDARILFRLFSRVIACEGHITAYRYDYHSGEFGDAHLSVHAAP